jgi:type 1 glutamine amidotransferase
MRILSLLTLFGLAAGLTVASAGAGDHGVDRTGERADRFRVLVFTKTTGFRHDSIPAGVTTIRRLGRQHRFAVDATEDATRFTRHGLARYDAVIFLSATGQPLDRVSQRRALKRYMRRGGGFLGIHAAADSGYGWRWYGGLVGARFRSHPAGTPSAVVRVEDRATAATRPLPRAWMRADEWYSFRSNPRSRVHVLATVDETTYQPGPTAMGGDHPLAWCHRYEGGRSVYTGMGHTAESYAEPLFVRHLLGAVRMAAGRVRFDCAHP